MYRCDQCSKEVDDHLEHVFDGHTDVQKMVVPNESVSLLRVWKMPFIYYDDPTGTGNIVTRIAPFRAWYRLSLLLSGPLPSSGRPGL